MRCATCGRETTSGNRCDVCGAILGGHTDLGSEAVTVPPPPTPLVEDPDLTRLTGGQAPRGSSLPGSPLTPGAAFGSRYRILRQLGAGGMGVVYQAWDDELGLAVALKVIKPEVSADPRVASEVEHRFKRELLLARQVTHKHVVRIHDIGEMDGIKYLTMPFIEGRDLANVLRGEGRLSVARALQIAKQIAAGLVAAHEAAVVHRDLKPENVMIDADEQAVIMDFGISRSESTTGATVTRTATGGIVGTMEYMPPEQATGQRTDHRADIYSLGLILYDMLAGRSRVAKAGTAISELTERLRTPPRPLPSAAPSVPAVDAVIARCTQADPAKRYQTAAGLLADLDLLGADGQPLRRARVIPARHVGAAALVVLLVIAGAVGLWLRSRTGTGAAKAPSAAHAPVSVLVADFDNRTGEAVFDDTLEPMFNVALEGASFLNAFNRGQARKLASGLPRPSDKLDPETARLVAVSKGIPVVVSGSLAREGKGYRITVRVVDARTGGSIASPEAAVSTKNEILPAIPKLVAPIRKALGDSTPASVQLESAGGAFTAASLETVHQYSLGMQQQFAGNSEQALRSFSKAAELDPGFARAYAGMAGVAIKLGQLHEADSYIKLAMEHMERMTDRERYRVRGLYYLSAGNWQKCAEEYDELVKRYPGDNIGHNNLAICLGQSRNLARAVEEARHDLQFNPNASAAANLSLFSSYSGDFQGGERAARELQQAFPSFPFGHLVLALAQLGQGQLAQASDSYRGFEKTGALGASFAASGLGDLALYEGRFADAVRIFERGAAADLAGKNPDAAAEKLTALAYAQLCLRKERPALAAADKALASSKAVKIRFLAGQVYAETGELAKARELAASLAAEISTEPQAYAKILEGMSALARNDARGAIKTLTEANSVLDTWIGRFELGRAYLEAGAFAEADSEFDRCIRRRGEALALFMDLVPTYGYLPPAYYYQGRVREGLNSAGAADSSRTYLNIRGKAGEDPLLPDIRRRLKQ